MLQEDTDSSTSSLDVDLTSSESRRVNDIFLLFTKFFTNSEMYTLAYSPRFPQKELYSPNSESSNEEEIHTKNPHKMVWDKEFPSESTSSLYSDDSSESAKKERVQKPKLKKRKRKDACGDPCISSLMLMKKKFDLYCKLCLA